MYLQSKYLNKYAEQVKRRRTNIIMAAHMTAQFIRGQWLHLRSVFTATEPRYHVAWIGKSGPVSHCPAFPCMGRRVFKPIVRVKLLRQRTESESVKHTCPALCHEVTPQRSTPQLPRTALQEEAFVS
jgi:hypothetical protein